MLWRKDIHRFKKIKKLLGSNFFFRKHMKTPIQNKKSVYKLQPPPPTHYFHYFRILYTTRMKLCFLLELFSTCAGFYDTWPCLTFQHRNIFSYINTSIIISTLHFFLLKTRFTGFRHSNMFIFVHINCI